MRSIPIVTSSCAIEVDDMKNFSVSAPWRSRPETPDQIACRLKALLARLRPITPHFRRWFYNLAEDNIPGLTDAENWLVSGSKRGVWTLDSGSSGAKPHQHQHQHTFTLTLVPLRAGSLTMPNVSITPLHPAPVSLPLSFAHQGQQQTHTHTASALPTSETYVENVAQRVVVFPGGGGEGGDQVVRGETFWVPDHASAAV